jgi:plastocyanin
MLKTMGFVAAVFCALAGNAGATTYFVTVAPGATFTFSPQIVFIQPGDTVTWTYAGGSMPHNVHADDNSYSNPLSASAWTFSHTFPTAMTSRYYCQAHGATGGLGMAGSVVVGGRNVWAPQDIPYTLNAWDFSTRRSSMVTDSPAAPDFHRNGPQTELIAGVRLPAGASITGMEVAGCDTGADAINANLFECLDPDAACPTLASVNTTGTPGCGYFAVATTGVPNVDNLANSYLVRVFLGSSQTLRAVRIFYRRPVSPAPAVATFGDVPASDPRYRFVEALARAGVTGGCGPGAYCPDEPITRGQMAVFLAVALGLYWPN